MILSDEELEAMKNTAKAKENNYIFAGYEILNIIETYEAKLALSKSKEGDNQ